MIILVRQTSANYAFIFIMILLTTILSCDNPPPPPLKKAEVKQIKNDSLIVPQDLYIDWHKSIDSSRNLVSTIGMPKSKNGQLAHAEKLFFKKNYILFFCETC